jgi:hypothetical protein
MGEWVRGQVCLPFVEQRRSDGATCVRGPPHVLEVRRAAIARRDTSPATDGRTRLPSLALRGALLKQLQQNVQC